MIYYSPPPPTKMLVEFLVNLTNEVVELLQTILIFLNAKGKGGTRGGYKDNHTKVFSLSLC
jgi:hypothetical protein